MQSTNLITVYIAAFTDINKTRKFFFFFLSWKSRKREIEEPITQLF